jgi:hypothetical protein
LILRGTGQPPVRSGLAPMAALGQEDQFPRPRLNGRYRFSQGTLAGTRGNGRDAPKAALPVIRSFWRHGREFVGGDLDGGGSDNRITRRRIDLRDRSEWVGSRRRSVRTPEEIARIGSLADTRAEA